MWAHPSAGDAGVMDATQRHITCEIRVRGLLGETLLAAFPGFEVTEGDGESLLSGTVADQAALFGVLSQVESLGLELLEIRRAPEETTSASHDIPTPTARELAPQEREGGADHG